MTAFDLINAQFKISFQTTVDRFECQHSKKDSSNNNDNNDKKQNFAPVLYRRLYLCICSCLNFFKTPNVPLIQEGQLSVTGERMCTKYW